MTLHLLILEDNPDDAELAVKELEREGFDVKWTRADTEETFRKAFDYFVPSFDAMAALQMYRQLKLEIPLIIFSGTIGEEIAVECMKLGATDYVLKDNLSRLGPVVKRALEEIKICRETAKDSIFVSDEHGRFIDVNQAACESLGYNRKELLKLSPKELDVDLTGYEAFIKVRDGLSDKLTFEVKQRKKDGTYLPVEITGNAFTEKGKQLTVAIARDISKRMVANKLLRDSEAKHRLLADNTVDFIWQMNLDLEFTYINQAIFPFFGYTPEEWIGSKLSDHCSLKEMEKMGSLITNALANLPDILTVMFETFFYHKNGEELPCEVNSKLVLDDTGNPLYFQGVTRDITERKLAEKEKKNLETIVNNVQKGVISALITTVEYRDPYTAGHQQRVSDLASTIAKIMGFSEDKIMGVCMAGLLHDIGKIAIPAEILSKSGPLNKMEFALIKSHPQVGYDILNTIKFPWPLSQIILQHHERIDGSGYPNGLLGKEILIESKILAVADVIEAVASHRPYRPSLGIDKALEEISINKGNLYDVEVDAWKRNLHST
jgi:PAS domain S-box-containing protein/putative nucleotidyltransferase with HDIG domain